MIDCTYINSIGSHMTKYIYIYIYIYVVIIVIVILLESMEISIPSIET